MIIILSLLRHVPIILQPLKFIISDLVTPTASAILVLFDSTAFSANVFTFRFEIIRMAASTEWRILVEWICKNRVYATAVASDAPWVSPVVARVIAARVMAEDVWCPAVC